MAHLSVVSILIFGFCSSLASASEKSGCYLRVDSETQKKSVAIDLLSPANSIPLDDLCAGLEILPGGKQLVKALRERVSKQELRFADVTEELRRHYGMSPITTAAYAHNRDPKKRVLLIDRNQVTLVFLPTLAHELVHATDAVQIDRAARAIDMKFRYTDAATRAGVSAKYSRAEIAEYFDIVDLDPKIPGPQKEYLKGLWQLHQIESHGSQFFDEWEAYEAAFDFVERIKQAAPCAESIFEKKDRPTKDVILKSYNLNEALVKEYAKKNGLTYPPVRSKTPPVGSRVPQPSMQQPKKPPAAPKSSGSAETDPTPAN